MKDCINMFHDTSNIRKSDELQYADYPFFEMPLAGVGWHKASMEPSFFDLELVREKVREGKIVQSHIAKAIGLPSQSAFSNILHGKRKVSAEEAARIYAYLGIAAPAKEPSVHLVPVIGITSAGRWREAIRMPTGDMPIPRRIAGRQSFAVEVLGDSMDKLIEDGGFIVVDPDRKELVPGACYLLQNSEHEATVKMYQRDPARFEPCSTNPEHSAFLASDEDFAVLGKVVWKGAPV